jgi:hypothetical protein
VGATVILTNLVLTSRINQNYTTSGIDSLDNCFNKQHFLDYPHTVEYQYNSRGFRDSEWPNTIEELQNAIWCVGDSFTVGLGSPLAFTWPQVLAKVTGRRCINISMDGASNAWISRRAQQIIKEVAPKQLVVLWSYTHRRESPDIGLPDEARRLHFEKSNLDLDDLDNFKDFINCYTNLKNCTTGTSIFNGIIPCSGLTHLSIGYDHITQSWNNIKDSSWPEFVPTTPAEFDQLPAHIKQETTDIFSSNELETWFIQNNFFKHNQLIELSNLDYARDYHHFDRVTSEFFVKQILKNFDS